MHIFTERFFGGNGIVGAQVPSVLALRLRRSTWKRRPQTFALYGDGASNQGQVFEAFNMVRSGLALLYSIADYVWCAG